MYIVIFITCANKREAKNIARGLVKSRLAACVNIIDNIESIFCWESKVNKAQEVLLIIKSKREKLERIIKLVKAKHSYRVPEIITLPIIAGFKPYLRWLDESLRKSR